MRDHRQAAVLAFVHGAAAEDQGGGQADEDEARTERLERVASAENL